MKQDSNLPLYIEHHWELMTLIKSYGLKGVNQQLVIYKDVYNKVAANQNCPCNKNHFNFLNSVKDNLNSWLLPSEVDLIKEQEETSLIRVKKNDGTLLEI